MKTLRRTICISTLAIVLFSLPSCIVVTKKDNGKHKGWFKNSNNPHHPATTNPGHTKSPAKSNGNGNGNGNGKSKAKGKSK